MNPQELGDVKNWDINPNPWRWELYTSNLHPENMENMGRKTQYPKNSREIDLEVGNHG